MDILLVDDDKVDRTQVIRTLKQSGLSANITEAPTVDQGLEAFQSQHYDIVLIDYRMPQRDGIEMIVELRSIPKDKSTAIIVMSASDDEEIALNCIKEGAQDFLIKSEISVSRLRSAILQAQTRFELEKELYVSYKEVKKLAETDSLTGLSNRYLFDESLKMAITNNPRTGYKVALLLIDLDNFKNINDTFGHDTGDLFLKKVVARLNKILRQNELVARLGGDEFGVIMTNVSNIEHVNMIAMRINHALSEPFQIGKHSIQSSASIGISIYPDNGKDNSELFKQADIAMYRSKKLGRNQACFFEEELQRTFARRIQIEDELNEALDKQEFYLLYQPMFNPQSEAIVGFEALIRWRHGESERYPNEFIPIAEETRQIIEIGHWVIDESLSKLSSWIQKTGKTYSMAINVSTIQLTEDGLADYIISKLKEYQIESYLLEIEVTETAFIKDTEALRDNLFRLNQYGCHISLDDFGTGFSSVSHLQLFPIQTLKIDRSLMPNADINKKNINLVKGVFLMAKVMGLDVIAEGVETTEDLDLCRSLGINKVQGYYYSKPVDEVALNETYFEQAPTLEVVK